MAASSSQTFLHLSDLHAGWSFRPEVGEALLVAAYALAPDAIVVSGDVVQRAELGCHWRQAGRFLSRFRSPLLVVPGNHDLPVFDPVRRLVSPLRSFRRHVHRDVERVLRLPGIVIVGLSSPKRWTLDLGYVSRAQRLRLREALAASPEDALRVAVFHHGLKQQPVGLARNEIRGSGVLVAELAAAGVHLALSGHNHYPHLEIIEAASGASFLWAQAGTATSNSLRYAGFKKNSFSLVRNLGAHFEVEWWTYDEARRAFARSALYGYARSERSVRAASAGADRRQSEA